MDALLGKITNLAYEFFGVLLPGVVGSLFLSLLWIAAGPLVTYWSRGGVPSLTIGNLKAFESALAGPIEWTAGLCLVAVWYFMGHAINWLSIRRAGEKESGKTLVSRAGCLLRVRVPRLSNSYSPELVAIFDAVSKKLGSPGRPLQWRELYPVAKTLLKQRLTYSLVSTYQNKYTLHRAISIASAGLFWLSIVMTVVAAATFRLYGVEPAHWLILFALPPVAAVVSLGFGASYLYAWTLFGDAIITETYYLLLAPTLDATSK